MIYDSNFRAHSEDFATWVIPYRREKPGVEWWWNRDFVAVFIDDSVWSFSNFGSVGLRAGGGRCCLHAWDWLYIVIEQYPIHLDRFARCDLTIWRAELGYLTWLLCAQSWALDLRSGHDYLLSDRSWVIRAILRLCSHSISLSCIGWPLLICSLSGSRWLKVRINVRFHGSMSYTTLCNFSKFCCANTHPVTMFLSRWLWLCLVLLSPLLLTCRGCIVWHLADYIIKWDKIL